MILDYAIAILVSTLLVTGAAFSLVASLGLIRFPDVYSRMHAASMAGTIGSGLILLAFIILSPEFGMAARAFATFLFLALTAPVAAHLLAHAAFVAHDPSAKRVEKRAEKKAN